MARLSCLVLVKSSTGTLSAQVVPFPEDGDLIAFMAAQKCAYKLVFSKPKRLLQRYLFFKKPVVSTVTLRQLTTANLSLLPRAEVLVRNSIHDETLTNAIRNPEILGSILPEDFFAEYGHLLVDMDLGHGLPRHAIVIHQETDPVAAKILGFCGSAASAVVWGRRQLLGVVT